MSLLPAKVQAEHLSARAQQGTRRGGRSSATYGKVSPHHSREPAPGQSHSPTPNVSLGYGYTSASMWAEGRREG